MAATGDKDESPHYDSLQVSDGNGPIDALSKALMKALMQSYPSLLSVELVDYKVRILDPEAATEAVTRVLISFRDTAHDTTWNDRGCGSKCDFGQFECLD